jgi:hypothetical protein
MLLNNCSLLLHVKTLLRSSDSQVRLEACDCLLVLAGLKGEIQGMISTGIIVLLISLLSFDEYLRPKIAKVLKYVTRGSSLQIR